MERQASVGWALAPQLVAHAKTAPTVFHKTCCFEMLLTLARQSGVLKQDPSLQPYASRHVSSYYYMCPRATLCVLVLLYMCSRTTIYVFSYF